MLPDTWVKPTRPCVFRVLFTWRWGTKVDGVYRWCLQGNTCRFQKAPKGLCPPATPFCVATSILLRLIPWPDSSMHSCMSFSFTAWACSVLPRAGHHRRIPELYFQDDIEEAEEDATD